MLQRKQMMGMKDQTNNDKIVYKARIRSVLNGMGKRFVLMFHRLVYNVKILFA